MVMTAEPALPSTDRPSATPARRTPPPPPDRSQRLSGRRVALLTVLWGAVLFLSLGLVLIGLEPLFQERDQRHLLESYRVAISRSANEAQGLPGIEVPTKAPDLGAPVAVLEVGSIEQRQVVVEGAAPTQTQAGLGHVPGTAAPGQPGNSVVIGRRATFGAPFADLDQLASGDKVLVTTTQGQSVYEVDTVRRQAVSDDPDATESRSAPSRSLGPALDENGEEVDPLAADTISVDALFGPTEDDRLTLVTSAAPTPWNGTAATVVVAKLVGEPFAPTPQGGRTSDQTGLTGDAGALASVILVSLALAAAIAAAVLLYRRTSTRVAYLLTVPVILTFVVVGAESLSRLFPAWM